MDKLPKIFKSQPFDYQLLLAYYKYKYAKTINPINRISESSKVSESTIYPCCGAPYKYIYKNNGSKGQYHCKVCGELFNEINIYNRPLALHWTYCGHIFPYFVHFEQNISKLVFSHLTLQYLILFLYYKFFYIKSL